MAGKKKKEFPVVVDRIDDVVAEDVWTYWEAGIQRTARVVVGKPALIPDDPNRDWYCPVLIEGRDGYVVRYGAGPVDALINATWTLRHFLNMEVFRVEPQPEELPGLRPPGKGP